MHEEPWQIMNHWIERRIDEVTKDHDWWENSNVDERMYQWAHAVANHDISSADHYNEPPIPEVIGYIAQIGIKLLEVVNPIGVVGTMEAGGLGLATAAYHKATQDWMDDIPRSGTKVPAVKDLKEWITERIKYAATDFEGNKVRWSDALTAWTDCIRDEFGTNPDDYYVALPSRLAYGFILHAACNHTNVPFTKNEDGKLSCELLATFVWPLATIDVDPWSKCVSIRDHSDADSLSTLLDKITVSESA